MPTWWLGWLLMSLVMYQQPNFKTIILVFLYVFSFFIGTYIKVPGLKYFLLPNKAKEPCAGSAVYFLQIGLILIILQQIIILFSIYSENFYQTTEDIRSLYFSGDLPISTYQFVIYELSKVIFYPVLIYVSLKKRANKSHLFAFSLGLLFTFFDSMISFGRFPFYFYSVFVIFFCILSGYKPKFRLIAFVSIFLFLGVLAISINRGEVVNSEFLNIFDYAKNTIINYHLIGFGIFEKISNSDLINTTYILPRYTFGFYEYIFSMIARLFNYDYSYPQQALNLALTDPIFFDDIGTYNAFGTNLLPLYLDGGVFFVFAFQFLLGSFFRLLLNTQNLINITFAFCIAYSIFFGIFQPMVSSATFLIPCLFYFIYVFIKHMIKNEKNIN